MDLSVIIVSYNSGENLNNLISSIVCYTKQLSFEIIVIDNNSSDDSLKLIIDRDARIKVIRNKINFGFAIANNIGLKAALGDTVVFLNPDVWFNEDVLSKLYRCLKEDANIGILGCKIVFPNGDVQTSTYSYTTLKKTLLQIIANPFRKVLPMKVQTLLARKFALFRSIVRNNLLNYELGCGLDDVDCVTAACMMFRKEVVNMVGFLDEAFFMYYEDEDFCRRTHKVGLKVKYCPSVCIVHALGWGHNKFNSAIYWMKYKSLKYYCSKYYKGRFLYYSVFCVFNFLMFRIGFIFLKIKSVLLG